MNEVADDLPPNFDADIYGSLYTDLSFLDRNGLERHYEDYGRGEGRRSHSIRDRNAFAALAASETSVLEIGPYFAPILRGSNVKYFDVFESTELRRRASNSGFDPASVPEIDYMSPIGDLDVCGQFFAASLSSHVIEHQPDLILHLNKVEQRLLPGGRYFIIVPDHRYCFNHFQPASKFIDILGAHLDERKYHTAVDVIRHISLTTHNDARRHWLNDHGNFPNPTSEELRNAADHFLSTSGYIDTHAWTFTPDSFRGVIDSARKMGLINLELERVYPTLYANLEFWAVLRSPNAK